MSNLNIIVIGAGMYVCGKGTDDYGTIMPAIFEWKKTNDIGKVYIAGKSLAGINIFKTKIKELRQKTNTEINIKYFPEKKDSSECYKEAIRKMPKPACVVVVVPDHLHREVAGYAIERGLHTLVVKPLAPTLKEVHELIRLQKINKVYCAVEFHKRLDRANLKLKDTISQGLIGDPLYFLVEYSQRKNIPAKVFKKWVTKTNVFQYLGIHYVDIIYFATGAIPKRSMATAQKGWLASKGIDAYDSIQGVIDWVMPSGKKFSSYILTNWIDPENTSAMSEQKIKVIGTRGRYESDQKKRGITIVTDEKGIEDPNPYFCSAYGAGQDAFYDGYGIASIHQFLADVSEIEKGAINFEDLEDKRPTFRQSIVPTAVLEKINASLAKNGKWVDI